MKKIKLIPTGGTISAFHPNRTDLRNYKSGEFKGRDFLYEIPELENEVHIEIEELASISSTLISTEHWLMLKEKIERALHDEGCDGVVITHGTNTLEETAYFLHLTIHSDKPVVLTGAQRPFSALSTDAHLNLIHAVKVAAAEESKGRGVLVVLNDRIHSAREVSKTNTYRLESFQSGDVGSLGYVDTDNTVQYYRSPVRKHTIHSEFSSIDLTNMPSVEIIYSYAGADGEMIRWLVKRKKVSGIVIAGTGAGRCSGKEEDALVFAREKGIHVVLSSRVGEGRVVPIDTYAHLSAVTSDNLLPHKARILLMVSLLKYNHPDQIQSVFDEY